MSEAPAGVIFEEPEVKKVDIVNKPEIIGSVETNKGRVIESDDLLFYTDRRGPEAFTKLLVEGRISSPGLAKSRGEKFVDPHGERNDLMSSVNEPDSIYTSLFGPYWKGDCSLVFNAWDTLEKFKFYDQGNTGLKLYNRDSDDNPAEFRFKDPENKTEAEFLILEPESDQGSKMRQTFKESVKDLMTPDEADAWLDRHIVSIGKIKNAAWDIAKALFDANPEYPKAVKGDLQTFVANLEKDASKIALQRTLSWFLKNDDNGHLAEWFTFGQYGYISFATGHSMGSIDTFLRSEESRDSFELKSYNPDQTISEPLTKLKREFVENMQGWLKQEFQKRFGPKTGREAKIESVGPENNKRLTLTIEKPATSLS